MLMQPLSFDKYSVNTLAASACRIGSVRQTCRLLGYAGRITERAGLGLPP